jgi:polysaccharide pyruvyl transferase WcaK-like protein
MKVLLHGSYYGLNFGDTLLMILFRRWINEAGSDVCLPLASRTNHQFIGSQSLGLLSAAGCSAAVFGGGGYFSSPKDAALKWTARAYVRHMGLAHMLRACRAKYSIFGVGVGPINSRIMRSDVVDFFNKAQTAAVRDEESLAHLHSWGLSRDVEIVPDAAIDCTLADINSTVSDESLGSDYHSYLSNSIAIHVTAKPNAFEIMMARQVISWWERNSNHNIIIINDSVSSHQNSWIGELNIKKAYTSRFRTFIYNGEVGKLISVLRLCKLVVSSKLHVSIIRSRYNLPIISIPHHPKTERFFSQANLAEWCLYDREDFAARLVDLLDSWQSGNAHNWTTLNNMSGKNIYKSKLRALVSEI